MAIIDNFFIINDVKTATIDKTEKLFKERIEELEYKDSRGKKWRLALWGIDIADGERLREFEAATADFDKCILIRGGDFRQLETIIYKEKSNHYNIKNTPYLDESDGLVSEPDFKIYGSVKEEYLTQFLSVNKKKIAKRSGRTIFGWVKTGQNDWRMSFIYALEVLDIQIQDFTLRDKLSEKGFIYNPIKELISPEPIEEYQEEEEDFIGIGGDYELL